MRRTSLSLVALIFAAVVGLVASHSWLHCADYPLTPANANDENYYNPAICKGYPRNFDTYKGNGIFGNDGGYDHIGSETRPCKTNPSLSAYTATYPMPVYTRGQKLCLAYPAKNHAAAPCTNQYIPDNGFWILAHGPYDAGNFPTVDPPQSSPKWRLVANLTDHVNGVIDYKGFQHCPKFCEAPGPALCNRCFDLPRWLAPEDGKTEQYWVFQWFWILNPPSPYTSCWEAKVLSDGTPNTYGNGPDPNDTEACPIGAEGCYCTVGGACDPGIICNVETHICGAAVASVSVNFWLVTFAVAFTALLAGRW